MRTRTSAASKLLITTILSILILSMSASQAHAFTNGQSASLVIGQKDFTSGGGATSQSGLSDPGYVIFDSSGNLWVCDLGNNRVLQFSPPFSTGMPASLVLGQKNFTTALPSTTKDGFFKPNEIAIDRSGNLWVLDAGNFRVLEFNAPFSNGMSASLVIGQANFEAGSSSATQSGLTAFFGDLAVDPSGNVWVGDTSRVLEFRAPFSNGMSASLVIGQRDFGTSDSSIGKAGLNNPLGLVFDSAGNLWVGDQTDNRVLEFEPPFSNGMGASLVIGHQDFATRTSAITQNGFSHVHFPRFDSSGNLWVSEGTANRILEFTSSSASSVTSTPSPSTQSTASSTTLTQPLQTSATATSTTTTSQALGQLPYVAAGAAIVLIAVGLIAVFVIRSRRKVGLLRILFGIDRESSTLIEQNQFK